MHVRFAASKGVLQMSLSTSPLSQPVATVLALTTGVLAHGRGTVRAVRRATAVARPVRPRHHEVADRPTTGPATADAARRRAADYLDARRAALRADLEARR
ncbi:MAG: hypothetical protein ACLGIR_09035 [Actinomycetes bacterium]